MRISVIIESTPKFFSAASILFIACFTREKVNYIFRSVIEILWSNGIYALRRCSFKLMCFGNMFRNFTSWFIVRTTKILLDFK